jgi:hypothetical protein
MWHWITRSHSQPNFVLTETAEIEIAPRQRDDPERLRARA